MIYKEFSYFFATYTFVFPICGKTITGIFFSFPVSVLLAIGWILVRHARRWIDKEIEIAVREAL